ncbi:MAG TPA: outer membrane beta-barrel protein [Gammaproteobacteria bacterium]|nr:outer membrane beta-barrel protein [Gammaproteobacteria bacterium]
MIKKLSIIAGVISAFTLTTAFAADGVNAKTGLYLGGGLSMTAFAYHDNENHWDLSGGMGSLVPIIGYRFNDHFALEWNYNSLMDDNTDANGIWGPSHYRLWTSSLAGKLIQPWSNGFSVYGKAGLAVTHQDAYSQLIVGTPPMYDVDETVVQPLLGVGVSYNFTQSTAIDLGVSNQFQVGDDIPNIATLMLGLTYTF